MGLSLGAGAETFSFNVTDDFTQVEWTVFGANDWKALTVTGRHIEIEAPVGTPKLEVRGRFYPDPWHYRTFGGQVLAGTEPTLPSSPNQLDGLRVALVAAVLGGLAASGGLWTYRRSSLAAQARRHEQDTHALRQEKTYYRADGRPPEQIDDFVVLGKLGQGGMATVFEVRHPDGTPGALKLPVQQLASESDFRKRFWREMDLGARLRHPGVIRIDYVNPDTSGESPPYYVMELLRGRTLDELPRPIPVPQALGYARQILETLDYIHGQQVYHRDLKPNNVMLLESGQLKIMDFGLALLNENDRTRLTASGQLLGTPAFMAPEQVMGGAVDARTDLYAVGLIVYEMVAGQLPFPDDTMQLLSQKLTGEVPPLGEEHPEALRLWVARMTAQRPSDRFGSAAEALAGL